MIYAIVILIALTIWHYVWEGILAPSIRVECRFRLFELRDKARQMLHEDCISDEWFNQLEDSLNTAIQVLGSVNFTGLMSFRQAIETDPELRKRIDARIAHLQSAPENVQAIFSKTSTVIYKAFIVNIGAWLLPLATVFWPIQAAVGAISRLLTLTANELKNVSFAIRQTPAYSG